jgi:hypothetical protein
MYQLPPGPAMAVFTSPPETSGKLPGAGASLPASAAPNGASCTPLPVRGPTWEKSPPMNVRSPARAIE